MYISALLKNKFLSKGHKRLIKNTNIHLYKLIELGIHNFTIFTNNIGLLFYLIENNFITKDELLIFASQMGNIEIIEYLIENGADLHYKNNLALRNVVIKGDINIIEYLVENSFF